MGEGKEFKKQQYRRFGEIDEGFEVGKPTFKDNYSTNEKWRSKHVERN